MKIKIIFPVTVQKSEQMLDTDEYLSKYIEEDTVLTYDSIKYGFPTIEASCHTAFNAPEVIIAAIKAEKEGCDGVFVNCFDDPGVEPARELLDIPICGGYVPSMHYAMFCADRIGIITTGPGSVKDEERKLRFLGIQDKVVSFEYTDTGVEGLEDEVETLKALTEACMRLKKHRIRVAVLGCTVMYSVVDRLRQILRDRNEHMTVIEPLSAGVKYLESVIRLGVSDTLHCHTSLDNLKWRGNYKQI